MLNYLEVKIREGLAKASQLKTETSICEENEAEIKRNSNLKYKVTEARVKQIPCENNHHIIHCMNCHKTCHDLCTCKDISSCVAMDSKGYCTICEQHCVWSDHKSSGFRLVVEYEEVEKTYEDVLKKYQDAPGKRSIIRSIVELRKKEYTKIRGDVEKQVNKCRSILEELREIALKPDPLSEGDYIEILIDTEKVECKPGFLDRVRELNDIKAKAVRLRQVRNREKIMPRPESLSRYPQALKNYNLKL